MLNVLQNQMAEWSYRSARTYDNPFRDLTLDVQITTPGGQIQTVPAFWSGENLWRVRYASNHPGKHHYRTICSDTANSDLHDQQGTIDVQPYHGNHVLFSHGPLRVAQSRRYLEHADGTPFFWLGDTWWMGLCARLGFPADFQRLTLDRVNKGFTVVQIVAGLYPDMPAFDPRGANEAGLPWTANYQSINPAYFDHADLRIDCLVRLGLVPCLLGTWGYHVQWMGTENMKLHWRYLIARYGAYPIIWCLAGEAMMPYYLTTTWAQDAAALKRDWTELTAYVRQIDPYHHPITIHPTVVGRDQIDDPALLDIEMMQAGHNERETLRKAVHHVQISRELSPRMPVINAELCYEGIGEACRQEVQRLMFFASMLSGAAGFTYGANGVWQVNTNDTPFGPSPSGMAWGNISWEQAYQLPGSTQLGLAKQLLQRFSWWLFEPHPEWVDPHWSAENYYKPYSAGIPRQVRIIFWPSSTGLPRMKAIESDVSYRAFLWDPTSGQEHDLGNVKPDESGDWRLPLRAPPVFQDWVLVLHSSSEVSQDKDRPPSSR